MTERAGMAEIHDVTDSSFETEILQGGGPAVVDFWSENCASCRSISPILEELAEEYAGRVKIVKCNAYENPATAARYGVGSMPTILGFSGGEVVAQLQGARPRSAFQEMIEQLL